MNVSQEIIPIAAPPHSARRLIGVIGLSLALGYLIVLGWTCLKGVWLIGAQGRPIANDFVAVFAAGRPPAGRERAAAPIGYSMLRCNKIGITLLSSAIVLR
jgi:hypothetical protein